MAKSPITQEYLDELISIPKRIIKNPRKEFTIQSVCRRKTFEVYSDKYNEKFRVFMRQSEMLPENYSIGLQLLCSEFDNDPILFRCNGPHGGNLSLKEHFVTHIHRCKLEDYNGTFYTVEKSIEVTSSYSTFDSAIYYFLTTCSILDAKDYFPSAWNVSLFEK